MLEQLVYACHSIYRPEQMLYLFNLVTKIIQESSIEDSRYFSSSLCRSLVVVSVSTKYSLRELLYFQGLMGSEQTVRLRNPTKVRTLNCSSSRKRLRYQQHWFLLWIKGGGASLHSTAGNFSQYVQICAIKVLRSETMMVTPKEFMHFFGASFYH